MIDVNTYTILLIPISIVIILTNVILRHRRKPVPIISKVSPIDASFKWDQCQPRLIRPFVGKKKFNFNMSIQNLAKTPEDWLLIENTYKYVTQEKYKLANSHGDKIISSGSTPRGQLAAKEYYDTCINFLTQRYPMYFIKKGDKVYNKLTDELIPLNSNNYHPRELLHILARNIEEDVVIFVKDDPDNHDEEYTMRASISGFPIGFDPSAIHNKPISYIHGPVPQYKERLQLSMSRFFNRLTPQDLWVRHNWSIQTHNDTFTLHDNHAREGEEIKPLRFHDMDFDNGCFLRCERQVLTRMPKSRALFMSVRTYLTPMSQIKAEGLGDELCRAIDLLPEEIAFYKSRGSWGEVIKQYLKS